MEFLDKKSSGLTCAPLCLSSSLQAVSINKAINTQEVAVKEKHARNILPLSYVFTFTEGYVGSKEETTGSHSRLEISPIFLNELKLNNI